MKEIWKPVPEWENLYEVSNLGNLRSVSRTIRNRYYEGQLLKLISGKSGYMYASLKDRSNDRQCLALAHRLIAKVFIPNPDNKPQVNHIDGNKSNIGTTNLEWCTVSENAIHAFKTGLRRGKRGTESHLALLDEQAVRFIKINEYNLPQKILSQIVGISESQVHRIINNKRWKHVICD
jgi:hypothetical protein